MKKSEATWEPPATPTPQPYDAYADQVSQVTVTLASTELASQAKPPPPPTLPKPDKPAPSPKSPKPKVAVHEEETGFTEELGSWLAKRKAKSTEKLDEFLEEVETKPQKEDDDKEVDPDLANWLAKRRTKSTENISEAVDEEEIPKEAAMEKVDEVDTELAGWLEKRKAKSTENITLESQVIEESTELKKVEVVDSKLADMLAKRKARSTAVVQEVEVTTTRSFVTEDQGAQSELASKLAKRRSMSTERENVKAKEESICTIEQSFEIVQAGGEEGSSDESFQMVTQDEVSEVRMEMAAGHRPVTRSDEIASRETVDTTDQMQDAEPYTTTEPKYIRKPPVKLPESATKPMELERESTLTETSTLTIETKVTQDGVETGRSEPHQPVARSDVQEKQVPEDKTVTLEVMDVEMVPSTETIPSYPLQAPEHTSEALQLEREVLLGESIPEQTTSTAEVMLQSPLEAPEQLQKPVQMEGTINLEEHSTTLTVESTITSDVLATEIESHKSAAFTDLQESKVTVDTTDEIEAKDLREEPAPEMVAKVPLETPEKHQGPIELERTVSLKDADDALVVDSSVIEDTLTTEMYQKPKSAAFTDLQESVVSIDTTSDLQSQDLSEDSRTEVVLKIPLEAPEKDQGPVQLERASSLEDSEALLTADSTVIEDTLTTEMYQKPKSAAFTDIQESVVSIDTTSDLQSQDLSEESKTEVVPTIPLEAPEKDQGPVQLERTSSLEDTEALLTVDATVTEDNLTTEMYQKPKSAAFTDVQESIVTIDTTFEMLSQDLSEQTTTEVVAQIPLEAPEKGQGPIELERAVSLEDDEATLTLQSTVTEDTLTTEMYEKQKSAAFADVQEMSVAVDGTTDLEIREITEESISEVVSKVPFETAEKGERPVELEKTTPIAGQQSEEACVELEPTPETGLSKEVTTEILQREEEQTDQYADWEVVADVGLESSQKIYKTDQHKGLDQTVDESFVVIELPAEKQKEQISQELVIIQTRDTMENVEEFKVEVAPEEVIGIKLEEEEIFTENKEQFYVEPIPVDDVQQETTETVESQGTSKESASIVVTTESPMEAERKVGLLNTKELYHTQATHESEEFIPTTPIPETDTEKAQEITIKVEARKEEVCETTPKIVPATPSTSEIPSESETDEELERMAPLLAMKDYIPDTDDAISLHEGEQVRILDANRTDWWFVRKEMENKEGWVPATYLRSKADYCRIRQEQLAQSIAQLPVDECKFKTVSPKDGTLQLSLHHCMGSMYGTAIHLLFLTLMLLVANFANTK